MRLRQRSLKSYAFKKRVQVSEQDGTTYDDWDDSGTINANVQPASGKLVIELYGARVAYMKTAYLEDISTAKEGDGLCIDVLSTADPDYKIIAIRPWNNHFVMDLETTVKKYVN